MSRYTMTIGVPVVHRCMELVTILGLRCRKENDGEYNFTSGMMDIRIKAMARNDGHPYKSNVAYHALQYGQALTTLLVPKQACHCESS